MNTSYNPLKIVNTYGAFGSITKERTEIIIKEPIKIQIQMINLKLFGKSINSNVNQEISKDVLV